MVILQLLHFNSQQKTCDDKIQATQLVVYHKQIYCPWCSMPKSCQEHSKSSLIVNKGHDVNNSTDLSIKS